MTCCLETVNISGYRVDREYSSAGFMSCVVDVFFRGFVRFLFLEIWVL